MPRKSPAQPAGRDFIVRTLETTLRKKPIRRVVVVRPSEPAPGVKVTPYLRCTLVVNGRHPQRISVDGISQILQQRAGEATLYLPGSWRQALPGGFRTSLVFFFTPHSVRCFCYHMPGRLPSIEKGSFISEAGLSGADAALLNSIELYASLRPAPDFLAPLLQTLMTRVADYLKSDPGLSGKSASTYHAIRDFIHDHFREPISRNSVADALRVHPAHVSRLFRTMGTLTFQEYLQHIRIEYACKLLKNPALTFKEVALESGFRDADHFRDAFRRERRQSPQQYRASGH